MFSVFRWSSPEIASSPPESMPSPLKVLFAPDYRAGISYQQDLADALHPLGVEVSHLSFYKRGLPLTRGIQVLGGTDVVHLHWPEAYFPKPGRRWQWRFLVDLALATRNRPLVLTAHNLLPHNRGDEPGVRSTISRVAARASAVLLHSQAAIDEWCATLPTPRDRCHLIPFGDHAEALGPPLNQAEARQALGLAADRPICLVFGTISPYKGSDEIVREWKRQQPAADLHVVGPVISKEFLAALRAEAGPSSGSLHIHATDWLGPPELRQWLSAADCSVFNYRKVFTSGAACLARSYGLPCILTEALTTVDLDEPDPRVIRIKSLAGELAPAVTAAVDAGPDYEAAQPWRDRTAWPEVARQHAEIYRRVDPRSER